MVTWGSPILRTTPCILTVYGLIMSYIILHPICSIYISPYSSHVSPKISHICSPHFPHVFPHGTSHVFPLRRSLAMATCSAPERLAEKMVERLQRPGHGRL